MRHKIFWLSLFATFVIIFAMNFPFGTDLVRKYLFFPQAAWDDSPENWGLDYEEVQIPAGPTVRLSGLWFPQEGKNKGTILLSHGNAGNISHRLFKIAPLVKKGFQVLLYDYRGYGKSTGEIRSESDLYEDGDAAFGWLVTEKKADPSEIVLLGESVGCAIALETATRHKAKAVVLESPFTSVPQMAKLHYPFLPSSLAKGFALDNTEKIQKVDVPLLQIHGTDDSICPISMGEELFGLAKEPKEFFRVEGADHNDLVMVAGDEYSNRIEEFIKKVS
jgi:fermentation-respiration switch protein FrsA (DUF1100 family)